MISPGNSVKIMTPSSSEFATIAGALHHEPAGSLATQSLNARTSAT
ncbi:MAG: hypothetical protein IIC92_11505 [Chloroflexi bacterium]|nr:hypothetical protein [Chloroflexota bacterium]